MSCVKKFNYIYKDQTKVLVALLVKNSGTEYLYVRNGRSFDFTAVGYPGSVTLSEIRATSEVVKEFYEGDKVELQF